MRLLSRRALELVNLFILEILGHIPPSRWEKERYYITCPVRFSCYVYDYQGDMCILFNYARQHSPDEECECNKVKEDTYSDYVWPHNTPFICLGHKIANIPYLICYDDWDELQLPKASKLRYCDVICILYTLSYRQSLRRAVGFRSYFWKRPLSYFEEERDKFADAIRSIINERERNGISIDLICELYRLVVAYLCLVHANTWVLCKLTSDETKELEGCTDKAHLAIGVREIVKRETILWILSHSRGIHNGAHPCYGCFNNEVHIPEIRAANGIDEDDPSQPPHTMLTIEPENSYILLIQVYKSLEMASSELSKRLVRKELIETIKAVHQESVVPDYNVNDVEYFNNPFVELGLENGVE